MTEPIWKGGMSAEEHSEVVNLAMAYLELSGEQRAFFQGYTAAAQSAPAPTKRKRGRPVGSKTRKPATHPPQCICTPCQNRKAANV
jgi:hypothetical protein